MAFKLAVSAVTVTIKTNSRTSGSSRLGILTRIEYITRAHRLGQRSVHRNELECPDPPLALALLAPRRGCTHASKPPFRANWSETRCRLMSTRVRFPCSHGKCRYASRPTASGRLLGGGAGSRRVVECAIVTSTFRCRCHGVWVGARQGLRACTTHVSRHTQAPVRVLGCIGTRRACEHWRQPSHPNPPSTTPTHQPPFAAELASSASCSMA